MICYIYESNSFDAMVNLATEEYFFNIAEHEECVILYLWQNESAVIIGKNQDPESEVNMCAAEKNGIPVIRRITGGGTVYHDLGNINFSFIMSGMTYDNKIMFDILTNALKKLSINACVSGRNDIYADDCKISGNAYYTNDRAFLHHGTILVDVDLNIMNELLNVPHGKMAERGISSVKSHVKNIRDILPDITVPIIKKALADEFIIWAAESYDIVPGTICIDWKRVNEYLKKYSNTSWNIGEKINYKYEKSAVYEWGKAKILYDQDNGIISAAKIFTDSLDVVSVEKENDRLIGKNVFS